MKRFKSFIFHLGLVLFSTFFILLLVELVLRATPYRRLLLPTQGAYPQYYFRRDLQKGYDLQENFPKSKAFVNTELEYEVWSNELGCFDQPYQGEKNPILLVGDSFAHMYAPFEEKWGTRIENLLGQRVLKCGVSGYGTRQALLKAQEVVSKIKTPPSLILLAYHLNDLKDDYLFPQYSVEEGYLSSEAQIKKLKTGEIEKKEHLEEDDRHFPPQGTTRTREISLTQKMKSWIDRHSILLNMMRPLVESLPYPRRFEQFLKEKEILTENSNAVAFYDYPWLDKAWEKHLENLREFKKIADQIGSPFLIVFIPAKEQLPPLVYDYTFDENPDLEKPGRIVSRFLKEEGIPFIDLLPVIKEHTRFSPQTSISSPKGLYWKRDGHWNIEGNRWVGLWMAKSLLEMDLVKTPDKKSRMEAIDEQLKNFP